MAAALTAAERLQLLQRSWTTVAEGYTQHFVPRFKPWTEDTLRLFAKANPPASGTIAVPACGPGQELPLLAAAFPRHRIVGVDLSEGMVELARQLVEGEGLADRVEVRAGDASRLEDDLGQLAGVVSCFGLQQMPQPASVLAAWTRALAPGGVLCVCFWPQQSDPESGPWRQRPWQLLTQLTASFRPQTDWEASIPFAAQQEGAQLLQDVRLTHEMSWPSAEQFWEAITRYGPWHSRRLHVGDEEMERLRVKFFETLGSDPAAPLAHSPAARIICLRRLAASL